MAKRFISTFNLLYLLLHVNSLELINDTPDGSELDLEFFSQIIASESPQKIYKSVSSYDLGLNNSFEQEFGFLSYPFANGEFNNFTGYQFGAVGPPEERNESVLQESHTSVLCDTDRNKTGGERKNKLLSAGVDITSVTTILNNKDRTCYIVHMTDEEKYNISNHYHLLPLTPEMKLRSETVNRITDKNRSTPIVIETLNFKPKQLYEYTNDTIPTIAESFGEKVIGFAKKDVLGQALYEIIDNDATSAFHDKIDNSTEISKICANSYSFVKFGSIDENLVNNLIKIQVNATDMEQYILYNYNKVDSSMSPKDIFETCILTLIMSMSLQAEVCSIEIEPKYKLFNEQIQYLVQSSKKHKYPWYDVGLNGKGEIVALSDAGIDINNCYFWDSDNYLKPGSNIDLNQRKIVQYDNYADSGDLDYGMYFIIM